MAKYTDLQAKAIAKQIHERFSDLIVEAASGSIVDPNFLAGFIGVEAGKDKNGRIKPEATRFEPHVFAALKAVRDGERSSYNKITKKDLLGATDAAIRALATSYSFTQIMGWHAIKNLKCTVGELRDPQKHLKYAVELLLLTAKPYLKSKAYDDVLEIWNTGRKDGKTHDPHYVDNALLVMKWFKHFNTANPKQSNSTGAAAIASREDDAPGDVSQPTTADTTNDALPEKEWTEGERPADENSNTPPSDDAPPKIEIDQIKPEPQVEKPDWGIKASAAAVITFLTTTGAGIIAWLNDAKTEIIYGFFGAATIVGVVFIVARFIYISGREKRESSEKMQREQRAHELQKLLIESAASKDLNAVTIKPKEIQNSEPPAQFAGFQSAGGLTLWQRIKGRI